MTSNHDNLSPAIRTALSELRWRIRAYVLAEGLAMAALWIGLTFWLGLALDYLPVLTWASEIPLGVRAVLLALVAGTLAWILFHWVLRRLFVRLRDRSMALLMERRFPGFHDELVTSVELASGEHDPEHPFDDNMLRRTTAIASEQVKRLRLADVFNPSPLITKSVLAVLLLAPIIPFALWQPDITNIWFQRFYMLKDVSWPRDTMIEVIGFQPQRMAGVRKDGPLPIRDFGEDKSMKIAKGSSGTLRVQAKSRSGKEPPKYCTVYYRSADGVRSSVKMNQVGRLTDEGYRVYSLASKPFKGVLEDLEFDIVANDSRLRDYGLDVVESPLVVDADLHVEFPDYLVDEATSSWLPRDMPYVASSAALPVGSEVTISLKASKPLTSVTVQQGEDGEAQAVPLTDDQSFQYTIDSLDSTATLFFSLVDTDGVMIERPEKFVIGAIKDNPPELKVTHLGIGSMVTQDVRIPVQGTASDDYKIDRAWFSMTTPDGKEREFEDVSVGPDGELAGGLDLRAKRALDGDEKVELKVGERITVTVMAADRYDLGEGPNVGVGVRMDLEVVTPEQLLTTLDQRELAQRRVFEHVIEEMSAARDDLSRVQRGLEDGDSASALELDPGEEVDEEQIKSRAAALRLLRVQQAGLQSDKSAQETLGVAAAFEDIVLELENNRVDSQDRQQRLTGKVAEPLRLIGETMFPDLDLRLERLEEAVGADTEDKAEAAKLAVDQVDAILAEMNKVLQDMLYIETYNELVETVRLILEEQARIREQTKLEQRKALLD